MGKTNKQKKKKKEADFVKPKLKVGKKKPAATNATNIAFKSSAINVLAQLEEKSEPTNRRNLSLKDLLTQLSHYNDNTRKDATQGLKDFFTQHPLVLRQNLSLIMPKLLGKAVDNHFGVRRNFLSCLDHILQNTAGSQIQPFFPVIMAHMNCAMTHINEEIQCDSIEFMDLCLDKFPEPFLKNCDKVLHSFLDLVSHNKISNSQRKGDHSKVKSKIVGRDLSVKPSGKMSTLGAKVRVFEKLLKIVHLVFKSNTEEINDHRKSTAKQTCLCGTRKSILLLKYELLDYDLSDEANLSVHCSAVDDISHCVKTVQKLVLSFMPALFSVWKDCNPANEILSADEKEDGATLQTMRTIILIIKGVALSPEKEEHSDFSSLYLKAFIKDILYYFPFDFTEGTTSKHVKIQDSNEDTLELNIAICEISCCIFSKMSSEQMENYFEYILKIANYVHSKFSTIGAKGMGYQISAAQNILCHLVSFCSQISNERIESKESLLAIISAVVQKLMVAYKRSKSFSFKCKLLGVLENMLGMKDIATLSRINSDLAQTLEDWLVILPDDLMMMPGHENRHGLQQLMSLVTTVIIQKRASSKLLGNLENRISHVLDSPVSLFTESRYGHVLQRQCLDLVFHLTNVSKQLTRSLALLCHNGTVEEKIKSYVCHVMRCCFERRGTVSYECFLSFIVSVVIGVSMSQLEQLQISLVDSELPGTERCGYVIADDLLEREVGKERKVRSHEKLCTTVLDMLASMDGDRRAFAMLLLPLMKLLRKCRVLPGLTAVGILSLLCQIGNFDKHLLEDQDGEDFERVARFLLSVVICESRQENSIGMEGAGEMTDFLELVSKVLGNNDDVLRQVMHVALKEYADGTVDGDLIAKSIWNLQKQQQVHETVKRILEESEFEKLQTHINQKALYML